MVLEALMLQMTKLFKNGLEKIQKFVETRSRVAYSREQGKNFTGWYRNKNIASDQMHFSSWKQDIFLAQNREYCCNGIKVQEALITENPKGRNSRWNNQ